MENTAFEVCKAEPPNSVTDSSQTSLAVPVLVGLLILTDIQPCTTWHPCRKQTWIANYQQLITSPEPWHPSTALSAVSQWKSWHILEVIRIAQSISNLVCSEPGRCRAGYGLQSCLPKLTRADLPTPPEPRTTSLYSRMVWSVQRATTCKAGEKAAVKTQRAGTLSWKQQHSPFTQSCWEWESLYWQLWGSFFHLNTQLGKATLTAPGWRRWPKLDPSAWQCSERKRMDTPWAKQSLSQLGQAPRAVTACPLLPQHFTAQTRAWDKKIRSERSKSRGFLLPSTPSREGFRSVFSLWKRSGPAHGCQGRALCSPSTDSAFLWKSCNSLKSLRSTRKLLVLLEIPWQIRQMTKPVINTLHGVYISSQAGLSHSGAVANNELSTNPLLCRAGASFPSKAAHSRAGSLGSLHASEPLQTNAAAGFMGSLAAAFKNKNVFQGVW